ncbi:MAG: MFS transporter [Acidobacteria bacterium]|nr:MFS transporter [Acidobacteriota bacterium]
MNALRALNSDGRLLFATRFVRLFAYGALSVVLVLYLIGLGLTESSTGLLLTATLLGDTLVSLYLTTQADRIGRRRMLIAGAALMAAAGVAFAFTRLATALGALAAGYLTSALQRTWDPVDSYRVVVLLYAAIGALLAMMFAFASSAIEARPAAPHAADQSLFTRFSGLHRSRRVVMKLAGLFAIDSFGGGFVVQSFAAYWFYLRFGVDPKTLGVLFFAANVFAGLSALAASRLAARIGLLNTMVVTHLPSNVLLMLIPLMPTLPLATVVLLLRFSISQMDVPTRQSYTMAVVEPDERSAASGFTGVARTTGAALSPLFAGLLFSRPSLINVPFFIAGTLKIVYDILVYREFRAVKPPEETRVVVSRRP